MTGPAQRQRSGLQATLSRRLTLIAVAVILGNAAIVALFDAADRSALVLDLVLREVVRLETVFRDAGGQAGAMVAAAGGHYADHPAAYAFALVAEDGRIIDGRNLALIPPGMLRPGPFATDWLAWPDGTGLMPVAAMHSIPGSDPATSVLFYMASDPADLLGREVSEEFRGHVWLPLLPIAVLLIGGTLLIVRRALRPVAMAAAWARSIRPGRRIAPFDRTDAPAEILDLTEAVRRSVARLEDELTAEQRRAAEAAHALRTPVAVLVARLDELPQAPQYQALRADVRALSRMVTQYLSSAGADRLEIAEDQTADLASVARQVVADLVPFADVEGAEIDLIAAGPPQRVTGSADAIGLALTNLIENAIHHAGGRIEVTVGPGPVLAVRDFGPGLPEPAGALFEPFKRGTGASRGGAGLGLAIVARIQRAHGGAVEASVPPGGGTLFRLTYRAA